MEAMQSSGNSFLPYDTDTDRPPRLEAEVQMKELKRRYTGKGNGVCEHLSWDEWD
jgi:hypothetical protein